MKKLITILLLFSSLFAELPFNKGVNLTQWFEVDNIRKVNFTKFTKQDFINIKSLGCDVVRLPMRVNDFSDGAPNYTLDPLYFFFLDQVIDWAEELEIKLILDNHTFSASVPTDSETTDPLISVWQQIAERYASRSDLIFYEVLNEPHDIDGNLWLSIQGDVLDAIREKDTKHTIIVGGHSWNTYHTLDDIPDYGDDNLIYTFHFYDPFIFTHQGADWGDPSLENLAGIPFPYNEASMPAVPADLVGTWVETNINNYLNEGTVEKVKELLDIAVDFQDTSGIQTYCGELGVLLYNVDSDDRVFWYEYVTGYLSQNNIPWTSWDYKGMFGLFEKGSGQLFEHDLNIPLLEAMGLNTPEQTEFQMLPDSSEFELYTDYIGQNIDFNPWDFEVENLDFYWLENVYSGSHCIKYHNAPRYHKILFDFNPDKDLSYLKDAGYMLEFYVKSSHTNVQFDVRFLDSVSDVPEDRPWRMGTRIDNSKVNWNGEWQKISIPLSDMIEYGSWHNDSWQDSKGLFDWTEINYIEFALENDDLIGKEVYFDDIKIVKQPVVLIADFSYDINTGTAPLIVQFTDNSTGEITDWLWDFSDGASSTEQNPTHTYENPGYYSVSLTVQGGGISDTIIYEDLIKVDHPKPEANFSADITEGTAPLTVQFSDSTVGEVTSWRWNFGDGNTSNDQNPIHTYESAGNHSVSLTTTGPGGRDTEVKSDFIKVTSETAISEQTNIPKEFHLYANYPNPFNPSTIFKYSIPKSASVKLLIFNSKGEIIVELVNKYQNPGNYTIFWDASKHSSGIYLYQLITSEFTDVKKCILIK